MYSRKDLTKTTLAAAVLLALGTGGVYSAVTDTGTTGNNFTMLGGTGLLTGGNNDTTFTWDGTLRTSVVTGTNNATLSSVTAFFGKTWTAKNVNVYGPGTYVFDTTNPVGTGTQCTADCNYTLTVPDGYLGAHMLFDWSTSTNIDVVALWKISQPGDSSGSWDATGGDPVGSTTSPDPFCATPETTGGCTTNPNPNSNTRNTVFSLLSIDTPASITTKTTGPTETNLYHGTKMIDGPFVGQSANFSVNLDATPDAFTFTDQTGVATSSTITSAAITVAKSGGTAVFPISVSSGSTYSTDGGVNYISYASIVTTGQTVSVRHTSSSLSACGTDTVLTIGGVSDTFTSTTAGAGACSDTTPPPFSFTAQTGVALNSTITSNILTVTGINAATPISVAGTGGTYSINGGAYTSTAGTVSLNDTVTVRHTSSSANSTATTTTLTIGGVDGTFTSTTLAATAAVAEVADPKMPGSGCSISAKPSSVTERGEWWLVAGFLAWLGALRLRFKRQNKS